MSNPDLKPKKSMNKMYIGIIAVILIVIIVAAATLHAGSSGTPTMSSVAGTYVGPTYNIILYANGTGLFSTYHGTWSILNSTTFEGTYTIVFSPYTSYFTFNNNGFTSDRGTVYVKK